MKLRIEGTKEEINDWVEKTLPDIKAISKFYPNTRGNTDEGRVYVDLK